MKITEDMVTDLVDLIRAISKTDSPPDTVYGRDKQNDDEGDARRFLDTLVEALEEED